MSVAIPRCFADSPPTSAEQRIPPLNAESQGIDPVETILQRATRSRSRSARRAVTARPTVLRDESGSGSPQLPGVAEKRFHSDRMVSRLLEWRTESDPRALW